MQFNAAFIRVANSKGLSIFNSFPAPNLVFGGMPTMGIGKLELRLKSNNLTRADIKKLIVSQIQIPKDEHGFMSMLENTMILMVEYLLKRVPWFTKVSTNSRRTGGQQSSLHLHGSEQQYYLASLMSVIDIKAQPFFMSLCKAASIESVNFAILIYKPRSKASGTSIRSTFSCPSRSRNSSHL